MRSMRYSTSVAYLFVYHFDPTQVIMTGWTDHVKAFRARHPGMSYKEALKRAAPSWRSTKGAPSKSRPGKVDYATRKGDKDFHHKTKSGRKEERAAKGKGPYSS